MKRSLSLLKRILLITGKPGAGKTTLIMNVARHLKENTELTLDGFITREIRLSGKREGFIISTFEGMEKNLAHVSNNSPYRVGRYGVSIENLNEIIRVLSDRHYLPDIWLIDEIGKMESLSESFCDFVQQILEQETPLIATIARYGNNWIEKIKNHPEAGLIELTPHNRGNLVQEIPAMLNILSSK